MRLRHCLGFSASQACLDTSAILFLSLPLSWCMFLVPAFLLCLLSKSHLFSFCPFSLTFSANLISLMYQIGFCPDLLPIFGEIKRDSRLSVVGLRRIEARPKQTDLSSLFQKSTDGLKTCKLNTSWTIWDENVYDSQTDSSLAHRKGHLGLESQEPRVQSCTGNRNIWVITIDKSALWQVVTETDTGDVSWDQVITRETILWHRTSCNTHQHLDVPTHEYSLLITQRSELIRWPTPIFQMGLHFDRNYKPVSWLRTHKQSTRNLQKLIY